MAILATSAALGAALCWAIGAILAHGPARHLGAFEFTRIQLISSAGLLLLIATLAGAWGSVSWLHWPGFVVASLIGVLVNNLAMVACLRRGGPRRTQLLETAAAPIAMVLAWGLLGESVSPRDACGAAIALAGVMLAILHEDPAARFEAVQGPFGTMAAFGLLSAAAQAAGLVAMKPALLAGTDPVAASAIRTGGAALVIAVIGLWPSPASAPRSVRTVRLMVRTIVPGILGYVVAVSLLLLALRNGSTTSAAVLSSTTPVLMLPMIWAVTGRRPGGAAWAGAALVVIGMGLMAAG